MMILIRFVLISLVIYLVIRSLIRYGEKENPSVHTNEPESSGSRSSKGVSKKIGEYIDYEDVKK
jgi:hypothetical protein